MTEHQEEFYEVECLLGYRRFGASDYYKVKWKGWPKEQSTWEPRKNLGKAAIEFGEVMKSLKEKSESSTTSKGPREAGPQRNLVKRKRGELPDEGSPSKQPAGISSSALGTQWQRMHKASGRKPGPTVGRPPKSQSMTGAAQPQEGQRLGRAEPVPCRAETKPQLTVTAVKKRDGKRGTRTVATLQWTARLDGKDMTIIENIEIDLAKQLYPVQLAEYLLTQVRIDDDSD
eukprot:GHVU01166125.1.p1 GENE.GHVU01166125.1~~GHVU01166125.1.p1  ORF type:complete len:245 (-),score=34.03 GHVU01166125.1:460-1149(-)